MGLCCICGNALIAENLITQSKSFSEHIALPSSYLMPSKEDDYSDYCLLNDFLIMSDIPKQICGQCQCRKPFFDSLSAACWYLPPLTFMLHEFKYNRKISYAQPLGQQIVTSLQSDKQHRPWPDLLIPIPLHTKKLKLRGFNQSALIGAQVSRLMAIPINYSLIKRWYSTQPQMSLPLKEREANVKLAFELKSNIAIPKHIAIIDDVVTTGATANSVAKLLKKNGAERVEIWCIARTPLV